jgi:hypothetical protein
MLIASQLTRYLSAKPSGFEQARERIRDWSARKCSCETKLMGVAIDLKSCKQLTIFVIDSLSAFSYDELRFRV